MKIAIAGKGGVGKTVISSVLAYVFSKDYDVVAIDCDPSMNLASTLGIRNFKPLSELREIIKERVGEGGGFYRLNPQVDDIVERYAVTNEDGIKVIVLGSIKKGGGGCFCPESAFLRAVLLYAFFKSDFLILDMDPGIEHLGRATAKAVDVMLAIIEPNLKSIETANRIKELAQDIGIKKVYYVINKYTPLEIFNFDVLTKIPFDEKIVEADIKGIPPYKICNLKPFEDLKNKLLEIKKEICL